jgi:hypothetical protein
LAPQTATRFLLPLRIPGGPFDKALKARQLFVSELSAAIAEQLAAVAASGSEGGAGAAEGCAAEAAATALEVLVALKDEEGRPLPEEQLQVRPRPACSAT